MCFVLEVPTEFPVGEFIAAHRKEKALTQKQLADSLGVTDKAVSKWERGLGYPDVTLLVRLAECLDVTPGELLRGAQDSVVPVQEEPAGAVIESACVYADRVLVDKAVRRRKIAAVVLSASLLAAALICAICNLAINGRFTWLAYPLSAIVFAWLVLMPSLCFRRQRVQMTLLSASIFVLPFLLVLNQAVKGDWFFPLAVPITLGSIVYLWAVLFTATISRSPWFTGATALLLIPPLDFSIALSVGKYVGESQLSGWDAVGLVVCLVGAGVLFSVGRLRRPHSAA